MLDAAVKALSQMFSPPFRAVLLKSVGLALLLIVLIGIAVHRVLVWLATSATDWAESVLGTSAHTPLAILAWIISIAASLGIIVGSVFLMPAVTALVGSFFVDDIALEVERTYYPADPVGSPPPTLRAVLEGARTALFSILVYLVAVPFLLFAGLGVVIFFLATAYLLGREYFELAAMRHQPVAEAKRLRKMRSGTVFVAGMFIAAFVSIPIVNLATPLFGMAFMVHMYKRMTPSRGSPINDDAGGRCYRARVLAVFHRPSLGRQLRHGDAHGAVGFRDHAQRLGVELDPGEAQIGDGRVNIARRRRLAEVGDGRLDALAGVGGERLEIDDRVLGQRLSDRAPQPAPPRPAARRRPPTRRRARCR